MAVSVETLGGRRGEGNRGGKYWDKGVGKEREEGKNDTARGRGREK